MKKRRFIHYSYVLFPIMIVITLVLTFSAKNNFTADFDNQIGVVSEEIRSQNEVREFVENELVNPFMNLRLTDIDENECFEHKLIFNYNYPEEEKLPFYKDQMVSARVVELDCEREYHLYSVKIYYDEKKILVRTSISEEWVSAETYINNYKKSIN